LVILWAEIIKSSKNVDLIDLTNRGEII